MSTGINVAKSIKVLDEGTQIAPDINQIDFTGTGVTATASGNNITVNVAGASGVFGISNASGVYTYYTTLTLAMAAATSGQTIEMFADVTETGNVTVNLKNNVNINLNGHTYILNNSGTANALQDNGVAVTSTISNGTINRINGNPSTINTLCLYITGASRITGYNLRLTQDLTSGFKTALSINNSSAIVTGVNCVGGNPTIIINNGTLLDSNAISINGSGITNSGIINNCTASGSGANALNNLSSGRALNCTAFNGTTAIYNEGTIIDCIGYSTVSQGIDARPSSTNINSSAFSSGTNGMLVAGGPIVLNCKAYSTAGVGIILVNGKIDSCLAYSSTSNAISTSNSGASISQIVNSQAISVAAATISAANTIAGSIIHKTTVECLWANTNGHAVVATSAGTNLEVIQCILRTSNTSANAINSTVLKTVNYAQNAYKGMTTPINANITQGITNTQDNQGNILI